MKKLTHYSYFLIKKGLPVTVMMHWNHSSGTVSWFPELPKEFHHTLHGIRASTMNVFWVYTGLAMDLMLSSQNRLILSNVSSSSLKTRCWGREMLLLSCKYGILVRRTLSFMSFAADGSWQKRQWNGELESSLAICQPTSACHLSELFCSHHVAWQPVSCQWWREYLGWSVVCWSLSSSPMISLPEAVSESLSLDQLLFSVELFLDSVGLVMLICVEPSNVVIMVILNCSLNFFRMWIWNCLELWYIAPMVFTSYFLFEVYAHKAVHLSLCFCSPLLAIITSTNIHLFYDVYLL